MNVSRAAIEQDRLLAGLDPSISRLAARGIVRSYRKNTIVLNEGEPGAFGIASPWMVHRARVRQFAPSTAAGGFVFAFMMVTRLAAQGCSPA